MKKISILISGLLLLSGGLTSCNYEQEMPPVTFPEGGNAEEIGTGAWDDPYYVWQVLAGVQIEAVNYSYGWVHGYVVGYIDTSKGAKLNATTATFAKGGVNSNILLAASPDEKNWEKCIPVQLNWGTDARDLSLGNANSKLGTEVCVYGLTGNKYRTVYGVRDCSFYAYGAEGYPIEGPGGSDSEPVAKFLESALGDCTIDNVMALPEGVNFIWEWSSQYKCAKATGFIGSKNYPSDSYLVTPEITLGENPYATLDQALNYLRGGQISDNVGIYVREGTDGEWKEAAYNNPPDGSSFTFVTSPIDLDEYAGKTVQIGLRYRSTSSSSTTWEVKNLLIY